MADDVAQYDLVVIGLGAVGNSTLYHASADVKFESLSAEQTRSRYPQIKVHDDEIVGFEPTGGVVMAERYGPKRLIVFTLPTVALLRSGELQTDPLRRARAS